ncbi:2,4-dihydroxyhept-2-ene-1,7-dioic acid aldolase [Thermaerobacter composti]|uniref:4-hydroxy-tetrahydrodipicolinate synthase n=1 Tax=Thermaerobacter composti TaxID=554949 RepID=A0ABZ0QQ12_9FIRM|nr:2,4-dihydroxyhept-2-ene-1,7-dioic acid aldolase [Thermaerobacter composti]WPD18577.1 2,4-dihydroxyhept-2-ene-1,7-dioic acid aldolase [Thermaerobacter composti]
MARTAPRDAARLKGSIVPLVTPFRPDGAIDEKALVDLIEWQIDSGSHGISVCGTTGEPSALSLEEREQVMELAARTIRGRVAFVPGTGTNNLDETLRLTRFAAKLGADAALVIVPYYNRPSQEGLYRYFRRLADAVDLPLILYNIPGRTAVNLEPATMARLRRDCPNIIGVKESNKDFEQVSKVLHACGRDFHVYSGIELLCYPMLAMGGVGHFSATANVLPREVAALYDHVAAGRWREAIDLHYHLLPMNEALFLETNPGPVKWVLGQLGRIHPVYRPPLCEPSPANQERLRRVMASYGLELVPRGGEPAAGEDAGGPVAAVGDATGSPHGAGSGIAVRGMGPTSRVSGRGDAGPRAGATADPAPGAAGASGRRGPTAAPDAAGAAGGGTA